MRWVTSSVPGNGNPRSTTAFIHSPAIKIGDNDEVYVDLATISGSSVALPAGTLYVRPSDGRLFRTI